MLVLHIEPFIFVVGIAFAIDKPTRADMVNGRHGQVANPPPEFLVIGIRLIFLICLERRSHIAIVPVPPILDGLIVWSFRLIPSPE